MNVPCIAIDLDLQSLSSGYRDYLCVLCTVFHLCVLAQIVYMYMEKYTMGSKMSDHIENLKFNYFRSRKKWTEKNWFVLQINFALKLLCW